MNRKPEHAVNTSFSWQIYPNIVSQRQLFSSFLNFIAVFKFPCHTLTT